MLSLLKMNLFVISDAEVHFARVSVKRTAEDQAQNQNSATNKNEFESNTSTIAEQDPFIDLPEEESVKDMFAMVGDLPRNSVEDKEKEPVQLPPVQIGVVSREFAVSRALGKYRQRHSSASASEDQTGSGEDSNWALSTAAPSGGSGDEVSSGGKSEKEDKHEEIQTKSIVVEPVPVVTEPPQPTVPAPTLEINQFDNQNYNHNTFQDVENNFNSVFQTMEQLQNTNPFQTVRMTGRMAMRHQASLEIPNLRGSLEDEDNRSMHSYRSTSRVSSRRQSTEESIDSEDEWYCYELRKLEEMERINDEDVAREMMALEPDEKVKEKMTFVLQELRIKAGTATSDIRLKIRDANSFEEENTSSVKSIESAIFSGGSDSYAGQAPAHATPVHAVRPQHSETGSEFSSESAFTSEKERRPSTASYPDVEEEDRDDSSGATSGPDSPHHSSEDFSAEDLARSRVSSDASTLKRPAVAEVESAAPTPPASLSGSVQALHEFRSRTDSVATVNSATVSAIARLRSESISEEGGKPGESSKWKLLKALKDRKAEDKIIQEAASLASLTVRL
jgi:hypothetical protein